MDIISRLKIFIDYLKMPVTQFADTCIIPRPTLSQLLNGRNKKVSNEVISKIHDAFPNLSVLWLMFGQGNMLMDANSQTSEPSNYTNFNSDSIQFIDYEEGIKNEDLEDSSSNIELENYGATFDEQKSNSNMSTIALPTNQEKKIVNIIVYYSDNSFESFVPGGK